MTSTNETFTDRHFRKHMEAVRAGRLRISQGKDAGALNAVRAAYHGVLAYPGLRRREKKQGKL